MLESGTGGLSGEPTPHAIKTSILLGLDASPEPVVFQKLPDGTLIACLEKAGKKGPQPGGRTRIAIPMRDPRNGGRPELMIDLVFLNEEWRGVGHSF